MYLVQLLRDADCILVFTGAGVSTGSGIRDFRGPKGVWRERQPVYFQDFMNSEAARIEYWDQKCQAWPSFRDAEPNAVHTSIADLERAGKLAMVITQNIDGLHSPAAGTSAERLVELHGTNAAVECMSCHARSDPDSHMKSFSENGKPPLCGCGGYLKPATISFGQKPRPGRSGARRGRRPGDGSRGGAGFDPVGLPGGGFPTGGCAAGCAPMSWSTAARRTTMATPP